MFEKLDNGGRWVSAKTGGQEIKLLPSLRKTTGLEFEILLSHMSTEYKSATEIDANRISFVTHPLFYPEINVLRYEILKAKRESDKSLIIRNETLIAYPGLLFRFDSVDKDMGSISRIIKQLNR